MFFPTKSAAFTRPQSKLYTAELDPETLKHLRQCFLRQRLMANNNRLHMVKTLAVLSGAVGLRS